MKTIVQLYEASAIPAAVLRNYSTNTVQSDDKDDKKDGSPSETDEN